MKAYAGVEVQPYWFVTLALDRNKWTSSHLAALPREGACGADLNRKVGAPLVGLESLEGEISLLASSAIKPRFVRC